MSERYAGRDTGAESEVYARKLELADSIRRENLMNHERIGRRHQIFYGEEKKDSAAGGNGFRYFWLRMLLSAALVLAFWGIQNDRIHLPSALPWNLSKERIRQSISEDFSKQVVDYIEDFTYTFEYEKTSIDR